MFEANLKFECENPESIKRSLEPDAENSENVKTTINAEKDFLEIEVKSKKLSHLKAIINSYISLVSMLLEAEKIR
ncbi:MAG TPA: KEOPS complex subunit Pcc1 [archaeon]|nr:KEOPS complex subunit Pcc1 [archaeon]